MAVLYQKYRPQIFAQVIGQTPITQTLINASCAGDLAHAYLFTGSRGVGKTTIARIVAKAANCTSLKDGDPCGSCTACISIAEGTALDVLEIDAASHTGVDNVRELIEHAQFRPTVMKTKVFIIDEVHMLSKAAFNALLKTLEEPPEHAMFILATTDIEKVPETIISRTQRYDFKRISSADMANALQRIAKDQKLPLPEGVIEAVISQSEGSMRDALSRLNMVASLGSNIELADAEQLLGVTSLETVEQLVAKIFSHDAAGLPDFFDAAFSAGTDASVFNRSVLQYLRELLHSKLTGQISVEHKKMFESHIGAITVPKLLFVIRLFLRSYKEISQAPSPELPLLLAAVEAALHPSEPVAGSEQVVARVKSQPQTQPQTHIAIPAMQSQPPTSQSNEAIVAIRNETVTKIIDTTSVSDIDLGSETQFDTDITIEEIQTWWPDVINRVKAENSPIATLLKNSPITEVINGKITVAVKYLFHKEHLDNQKHNAMIIESISAVSGKNLSLKSVINKELGGTDSKIVQTVDSINDALRVFGGELVE